MAARINKDNIMTTRQAEEVVEGGESSRGDNSLVAPEPPAGPSGSKGGMGKRKRLAGPRCAKIARGEVGRIFPISEEASDASSNEEVVTGPTRSRTGSGEPPTGEGRRRTAGRANAPTSKGPVAPPSAPEEDTPTPGGATGTSTLGMASEQELLSPALPPNGAPPLSPVRAKRGRPITTGKGVGIRERLEKEARERRERQRERLIQEVTRQISGGLLDIRRGGGDPSALALERDTPEAVRFMSTTDLAAGVGQCLQAISLVGKKSGSLHGRLQGALNRAVDNIMLATTAMAVRLGTAEGGSGESPNLLRELKELREEVRALRAEKESLREDLERLKQQQLHPAAAPPTPPSPQPLPMAASASSYEEEFPLPGGRPKRRTRGSGGDRRQWIPEPMETDVPVYDDGCIQDEAGAPYGREAIVWRPPIKGKSTALGDLVPGVQEADRGTYQLLGQRMQDLVDLMVREDDRPVDPEHKSAKWKDLYAEKEALGLERERLRGKYAQVDVPPRPAPRQRAPKGDRPPAVPGRSDAAVSG